MSIIHLLFAEDGIIFTRAKTKDYTKLKHIFDSYTAVSGQIFNYEKSSMFFNKKTLKLGKLMKLKAFFSLMLSLGMRSIWGCHPWWEEKKK